MELPLVIARSAKVNARTEVKRTPRLTWLLYDNFLTAENPATDPRTCEPGPGTIDFTNLVVAGYFQIKSDGTLYWDRPGGNYGNNNYRLDSPEWSKEQGLFMYMGYKPYIISNQQFFDTFWHPGSTGIRNIIQGVVVARNFAMTYDNWYELLVINTYDGALNFVRGYTQYTDWTLLLVDAADNDITKKFYATNYNGQCHCQKFRAGQRFDSISRPESFLTDFAPVLDSGKVISTEADGITTLVWTPDSSATLTILFRRQDDDNCLKLVCTQATSAIALYERISGSDTSLGSGSQSWSTVSTNGYRIQIRHIGDSVIVVVDGVLKIDVTETSFQTETGAKVTLGTGTGIANFKAYPGNWEGDIETLRPPHVYRSSAPDENLFAFVFDLHCSPNENGVLWLHEGDSRALAEHLNGINPHGVVFGGDLGNDHGVSGDYQQFRDEIWGRLRTENKKLIPGNHDEDTDHDVGSNDQFTVFNGVFPVSVHPRNWTMDWPNPQIRIIGIHTYIQHGGAYASFFNIDSSVVDWLINELDNLPSSWKAIVVSHAPYASAFGAQIHSLLGESYLTAQLTAGYQAKILAWFNGHRHAQNQMAVHNGINCYNCIAAGESQRGFILAEYDSANTRIRLRSRMSRNLFREHSNAYQPIINLAL